MSGGPDLQAVAVQAANANGLDPNFFVSLIGQGERGFANPGATSPKGATGPGQLMPGTAKDMGVADPSDPVQNLYGAAKYAKQLWDKYQGDPSLTAAAYNAGPGAVDRHGGVPPYKETQRYVARVTGAPASSGGELPDAADVMKAYGWGGQAAPQAATPTPATPAPSDGLPSPEDVGKAYGWKPAQPAASAPQPKRSLADDVTGFMSKVNRGLGIGDELAAGAGTVVNALTGKGPQGYSANLARQREIEDGYQAAHPNLAALATGTGNALTVAAPAGPGAQAFATGGKVVNALRGATVAGLTGAGYAAVDRGTLAERAGAAADAAHDPLTLALGAGAGALAAPAAAKVEKAAAPTLDALTAARDAAYKAVSDFGARYTPEAFGSLANDLTAATGRAQFNARLHPKAAAMLDYIHDLANQATGFSPTPTELDQLRQVVGSDVAGSADAGERRMGVIMKRAIDQFMNKATPAQITGGGDPAQIAQTLAQARGLNGRIMKLEKLDGLDEAAADRASVSGAGANINNTTRQNVLRFKNQTPNLTPAEEAAAQKVIDGTLSGNALRKLGKLSPGNGGLMANGQLLAAELSHGATVPVGIAGAVSKALADYSTSRNVQALRNLIATGGEGAQEVSRQIADPRYADLRRQLASDLAVAAGVQGAARRGSVQVEVVGHPEYGVGASSR